MFTHVEYTNYTHKFRSNEGYTNAKIKGCYLQPFIFGKLSPPQIILFSLIIKYL